ncbi:hypothetical protein A167_00028 [Alcanivorax sp. S71-1-4]|nr:hypothetical protein A167_00028 [Alcanivorax sp. S71-1-4]
MRTRWYLGGRQQGLQPVGTILTISAITAIHACFAMTQVRGLRYLASIQQSVAIEINPHQYPHPTGRAVIARCLDLGANQGHGTILPISPVLAIYAVADIGGMLDFITVQHAVSILVHARVNAMTTNQAFLPGINGSDPGQGELSILPITTVLAVCTILAIGAILAVTDVAHALHFIRRQYAVPIPVRARLDAPSASRAVVPRRFRFGGHQCGRPLRAILAITTTRNQEQHHHGQSYPPNNRDRIHNVSSPNISLFRGSRPLEEAPHSHWLRSPGDPPDRRPALLF